MQEDSVLTGPILDEQSGYTNSTTLVFTHIWGNTYCTEIAHFSPKFCFGRGTIFRTLSRDLTMFRPSHPKWRCRVPLNDSHYSSHTGWCVCMTHIFFVCIFLSFLSFLSTCFFMLPCPRPNCSRRVLFNRNNKRAKECCFEASEIGQVKMDCLSSICCHRYMQTNLYVMCIYIREIHSFSGTTIPR